MLDALRRDFRGALDGLLRRPAFTAAVLLTLSVGIGANAAIFTIVDVIYLKPFPYERPDELTFIWTAHERRGVSRASIPYDDVDELRGVHGLSDLARYQHADLTLSTGTDAVRVAAARLDDRLLPLLGAAPAVGRGILPADTVLRAARVVILGPQIWRDRFGADPDVVGRTVTIDAEPYEIVGVLDRGFVFPPHPDLPARPVIFVPLARPAPQMARMGRVYTAMARRSPSVPLASLQASLDAVAAAAAEANPRTHTGWGYRAVPLREQTGAASRPTLLLLLSAAALVLLAACANISILLLSRAAGRRRELGIRLAIGGTPARLVRQLAAEGLLVGLAGGTGGLLLGYASVSQFRSTLQTTLPRLDELQLDARLGLFVVAISVLSACMFTIAPALYASRAHPSTALRETARGASQERGLRRLHDSFALVEIALAALLVTMAFGLGASLRGLERAPTGFSADSVLALDVNLPVARYREGASARAYYRRLFDAVAAVPGIRAAGGINLLPPSEANLNFPFVIEGAASGGADELRANFRVVTGAYFDAMGVPVLAGRTFGEADTDDARPVVMVNRALATRFFDGRSPVGARISVVYGMGTPVTREIIGVTGDVRQRGPGEPASPELYLPYSQETFRWMTVVARTTGPPRDVAPAIRAAIRAVDADVAIDDVTTVRERASRVLEEPRLRARLVGALAALALALAFVGVTGVVTYALTARVPEFGVRLALGATPANLRRMILRDGLALAATGSTAGALGALLAARYATAAVAGWPALDPWTALAAAIAVSVASLAAIAGPAVRASRLSPLTALR